MRIAIAEAGGRRGRERGGDREDGERERGGKKKKEGGDEYVSCFRGLALGFARYLPLIDWIQLISQEYWRVSDKWVQA